MKTNAKRTLVFTGTSVAMWAVQWISGIPFQRDPFEALWFVTSLVVAALAASYPGLEP